MKIFKLQLFTTAAAVFLAAGDVWAYVGPGLGVGAIGALIGIILTVFLAIVGVFWYPLKRLFRKRKATAAPAPVQNQEFEAEDDGKNKKEPEKNESNS